MGQKFSDFKRFLFPSKTYLWEGIDFAGGFICGICIASSKAEVRKMVVASGSASPIIQRIPEKVIQGNFGPKQAVNFAELMIMFLNCGMKMEAMMKGVVQESRDLRVKYVAVSILTGLNSGDSFAESFAPFRNRFPILFSGLIGLCQKIDDFPGVLTLILDYYRYANSMKKNFMNFARYPIIVLSTVFILSLFSLIFVIPMFQDLYDFIGEDLNILTSSMIFLSDILLNFSWQIALICSVMFILAFTPKFRFLSPVHYLIRPFFTIYQLYSDQLLFSRAMVVFLKSGQHLEDSIEGSFSVLSTRNQNHPVLFDQIRKGFALSTAIPSLLFLPKISRDIITLAERSGKFLQGFEQLNLYISEIWERRFHRISALVHPILFSVAGILIVYVLLALYLPLFQLADKV